MASDLDERPLPDGGARAKHDRSIESGGARHRDGVVAVHQGPLRVQRSVRRHNRPLVACADNPHHPHRIKWVVDKGGTKRSLSTWCTAGTRGWGVRWELRTGGGRRERRGADLVSWLRFISGTMG